MDENEMDSGGAEPAEHVVLRLYVTGGALRSARAIRNVCQFCETHFPGRYDLEVIDLLVEPHRAQSDQILAIPTLVRKLPEPIKKIIGDLSNIERVLIGVDLRSR